MEFRVRATGVLIENDCILLVRQSVTGGREWSLPGGRIEAGETLGDCLKREIKEETGLEVDIKRLLYVCDRLHGDSQVLHITLEMTRVGGSIRVGMEPEGDANPIADVQMVPVRSLVLYGFSRRFMELATADFPDAGRYAGDIESIGL
jgi:ADP-ribose pyrophosphatase YjhB (NUDIX family)